MKFADGGYANVNLEALGAMIELPGGVTTDAVEFVYRLGLASGMVVASTIDPDVIAILPQQFHPGIRERWPHAAEVRSAAELMAWLEAEVAAGHIA